MLQVSVYRYNPDQDAAPFMQEFQVDTGGKDLMVLVELALIKEQDEGFSYRRSCREGVCGSDGMNINGKNGLACITLSCMLGHPRLGEHHRCRHRANLQKSECSDQNKPLGSH